jgi:hypothetical protein
MAVTDVYSVKWEFEDTNLGTIYTPGIHVRQDGASFDANDVADVMKDVWITAVGAVALREFYKTTTRLNAILIRRVSPLEPIEQRITSSLPSAGLSTGEQLAPGNAVLISMRTANIGRSYRGRLFLPAPTETVEDSSGSMSAVEAAKILACVNQLDALDDVGLLTPQVVWSPLLSVATAVTQRRIDRRFRSQRRRAIENPLYVT